MQTPTNAHTDVLIACPPGALRTGLQALLEALPWVKRVQAAGSLTELEALLGSARPGLVILAGEFSEQPPEAVLAGILEAAPGCRVAVLREQPGPTEPPGGANLVLQQGTSPADLVSALERLAHGKETKHEA
jgi:DNA-binding NarL/FixJ family response regulator